MSSQGRKLTSNEQISAQELQWRKSYAAFLRATGCSYQKIASIVHVRRGLVKEWFEDEELQDKVHLVQQAIVDNTIKFLNESALEMAQIVADIARLHKMSDPAVALRAAESALDRVGLSKVNKSESKVTKENKDSLTLSDDEFLDKVAGLPLESQTRIAELATEMQAEIEKAKYQE
jgi:hypothetical protein